MAACQGLRNASLLACPMRTRRHVHVASWTADVNQLPAGSCTQLRRIVRYENGSSLYSCGGLGDVARCKTSQQIQRQQACISTI